MVDGRGRLYMYMSTVVMFESSKSETARTVAEFTSESVTLVTVLMSETDVRSCVICGLAGVKSCCDAW